MELWFPAMFVVAMFTSALNSKSLGASICLGLGLICVYPNVTSASLLTILYIPAVLLSNFRD
jgi:hypothetical protein